MEVAQVLHMNGGDGATSYAHNSLLQRNAISRAKPIFEEAIEAMHSLFPTTKSFAMADLGCSSGPNTLLAVREFVAAVLGARTRDLGKLSVDFRVYLNDLPGSDFNTIFKALPAFKKQLKSEMGAHGYGRCLAYGAPGSFYERLFEDHSLHFVHSSYSIHFLSQVPEWIGRSNKSNICVSSSSPASVIKAYYRQFQRDFSTFLRHRSEELVSGGCMVLTLLGRKSKDPCSKESIYIWQLLALTLHQMVFEGLIEEEKLDVFNIPIYTPSPTEIENEVKKEGSFVINHLQVSEVDWDAHDEDGQGREKAYVSMLSCMRAVAEPMLVDHFGRGLMDEVFKRFSKLIDHRTASERTFVTEITVSSIKSVR